MEPGLTTGPWETWHLGEERAEDRAHVPVGGASQPSHLCAPLRILGLLQIAFPVVILLAVSCPHLRFQHRSTEITDVCALPMLWGTEDFTLV